LFAEVDVKKKLCISRLLTRAYQGSILKMKICYSISFMTRKGLSRVNTKNENLLLNQLHDSKGLHQGSILEVKLKICSSINLMHSKKGLSRFSTRNENLLLNQLHDSKRICQGSILEMKICYSINLMQSKKGLSRFSTRNENLLLNQLHDSKRFARLIQRSYQSLI